MLDGLAGKAHAGGVDLRHLARQSMAGQAEAVGAEGVGFENLRAGLQILLVNGENQAGVGEVQLVVAAVDEDAAGIENGAHGAIGEHGAAGEDVGKLGHSLVMLSHAAGCAKRGPLCYTSVVIRLGSEPVTGHGRSYSADSCWALPADLAQMVHAGLWAWPSEALSTASAAMIRVLRRGKGF